MAARQVQFPQAPRDALLHARQDAPLNAAQNVPPNAAQADSHNPAQADGHNAPQNVPQALQVQQVGPAAVLQDAFQNADAQDGELEVNILASICRQGFNLMWARFLAGLVFREQGLTSVHFAG